MESMKQAPGGEQATARHNKVQRKRKSREALTQRPGDTTVAWRGSARAATMASSQRKTPTTRRRNNKLTKPKHHRGRGLATREWARDRHGQSLEFRRRRDADDEDAIEQISRTGGTAVAWSIDWVASRRRTPTELVRIERGGGAATQSPGESRERRGTSEREGKEAAGRNRPSHWSGSASWLVRQVGQAGQWEREVEGVFLTRKLKTEIEKKKRTFLEKGFSM
jgi:hypothetical protein